MSQPNVSVFAPVSFPRRALDWWLVQMRHALPPTIFFFIGFNLILWTKRLILEEHGIDFSGFFTATVAALLVGKAVLVTDSLPFMRRFEGAPLISAHLVQERDLLAVRADRAARRGTRSFPRRWRCDRSFPGLLRRSFFLAALSVDTAMVDGAVPRLCHRA